MLMMKLTKLLSCLSITKCSLSHILFNSNLKHFKHLVQIIIVLDQLILLWKIQPSSTKVFQEFGHSFVSYVLIFKINSILFRIQKLLTNSAFLCAADFLKSQIVAVSKQLLARKLAKILFVFIKIFEYVRSYSSVSLLQSVAVKCSGVA